MPAALRGCGPSRSDLLPRAQVGDHDPDHAVHSCARCDRNLRGARYDQIRQEAVVSSSLVGPCAGHFGRSRSRGWALGIQRADGGLQSGMQGAKLAAAATAAATALVSEARRSLQCLIVAMPVCCAPGDAGYPTVRQRVADDRRPAPGLQAARQVHGSSSAPLHTKRRKRVCAPPRQHVCGVRRWGWAPAACTAKESASSQRCVAVPCLHISPEVLVGRVAMHGSRWS